MSFRVRCVNSNEDETKESEESTTTAVKPCRKTGGRTSRLLLSADRTIVSTINDVRGCSEPRAGPA